MIGEIPGQGSSLSVVKWCGALFVPYVRPVPHTDTDPRTRRASASMLRIMRFGLLLLSCRGEGL
ncbi:putative uncharacterized protein [Streptomyces azureus]|uniref:Uncharacterized protein n=1 Tax=Streptomyces azureus TaxID=146537 RepID=A0A0K8PC97_STRAJ|nr:putative uncharacterized protein [Streptomyces azureus]